MQKLTPPPSVTIQSRSSKAATSQVQVLSPTAEAIGAFVPRIGHVLPDPKSYASSEQLATALFLSFEQDLQGYTTNREHESPVDIVQHFFLHTTSWCRDEIILKLIEIICDNYAKLLETSSGSILTQRKIKAYDCSIIYLLTTQFQTTPSLTAGKKLLVNRLNAGLVSLTEVCDLKTDSLLGNEVIFNICKLYQDCDSELRAFLLHSVNIQFLLKNKKLMELVFEQLDKHAPKHGFEVRNPKQGFDIRDYKPVYKNLCEVFGASSSLTDTFLLTHWAYFPPKHLRDIYFDAGPLKPSKLIHKKLFSFIKFHLALVVSGIDQDQRLSALQEAVRTNQKDILERLGSLGLLPQDNQTIKIYKNSLKILFPEKGEFDLDQFKTQHFSTSQIMDIIFEDTDEDSFRSTKCFNFHSKLNGESILAINVDDFSMLDTTHPNNKSLGVEHFHIYALDSTLDRSPVFFLECYENSIFLPTYLRQTLQQVPPLLANHMSRYLFSFLTDPTLVKFFGIEGNLKEIFKRLGVEEAFFRTFLALDRVNVPMKTKVEILDLFNNPRSAIFQIFRDVILGHPELQYLLNPTDTVRVHYSEESQPDYVSLARETCPHHQYVLHFNQEKKIYTLYLVSPRGLPSEIQLHPYYDEDGHGRKDKDVDDSVCHAVQTQIQSQSEQKSFIDMPRSEFLDSFKEITPEMISDLSDDLCAVIYDEIMRDCFLNPRQIPTRPLFEKQASHSTSSDTVKVKSIETVSHGQESKDVLAPSESILNEEERLKLKEEVASFLEYVQTLFQVKIDQEAKKDFGKDYRDCSIYYALGMGLTSISSKNVFGTSDESVLIFRLLGAYFLALWIETFTPKSSPLGQNSRTLLSLCKRYVVQIIFGVCSSAITQGFELLIQNASYNSIYQEKRYVVILERLKELNIKITALDDQRAAISSLNNVENSPEEEEKKWQSAFTQLEASKDIFHLSESDLNRYKMNLHLLKRLLQELEQDLKVQYQEARFQEALLQTEQEAIYTALTTRAMVAPIDLMSKKIEPKKESQTREVGSNIAVLMSAMRFAKQREEGSSPLSTSPPSPHQWLKV